MVSANSDLPRVHEPRSGSFIPDLRASGLLGSSLNRKPCALVEIQWDEGHDTCARRFLTKRLEHDKADDWGCR